MMKIKPVKVESIENPKRFLDGRLLTKIEVEGAIEKALKQLYINIDYFGEEYPTPATFNNTYKVMDNTEWTNGFWTGCLWLAYEYNQDKKLKNIAHKN
ncbi:glucuronyl hydrolase, partial [Streptococcus agalactiae]|nr:glucuronyl hydrolase [Streptococcus agalactiae]